MAKYVIGPDVALHLAHREAVIPGEYQVLAPALLRLQLLSLLYQAVHRGEMDKRDADRRLHYMRGLRIRLPGDRVLQNVAWQVADQLGWNDTLTRRTRPDPAPRRRLHHARLATRPGREGSGDCRTYRGPVRIELTCTIRWHCGWLRRWPADRQSRDVAARPVSADRRRQLRSSGRARPGYASNALHLLRDAVQDLEGVRSLVNTLERRRDELQARQLSEMIFHGPNHDAYHDVARQLRAVVGSGLAQSKRALNQTADVFDSFTAHGRA